jgi:hypothetical protein
MQVKYLTLPNRLGLYTMKMPIMKNLKPILTACFAIMVFCASAQEEEPEEKGKFKKQNIFLGTAINLGITGTAYNIGVNPEAGYSITKWLDAGVGLNFNYFSQNASDYNPYHYTSFNYGGAAFMRIWPVNFLHLEVRPEYNWSNASTKDVYSGIVTKNKLDAGSLLVGIGYGSRTVNGNYSFVTLMIDVLQNYGSPYRDQYNDPLPVFRAGFGIYLKPKRQY